MSEKRVISSERKIKNSNFNITIGTMDKKYPSQIYIDINGYITPKEIKDDYEYELDKINNLLTKEFNSFIKENYKSFEKNAICIFDTAKKRMTYNKKSYFSLQIFVKLKNGFVEKNNSSFSKLIKTNEMMTLMNSNDLNEVFYKYGFNLSKTKR